MKKENILILGIDTISKKNTYQIKACNELNYNVKVFSNDRLNKSNEYLKEHNDHFLLKKSFFPRLLQVLIYLIKNHQSIHHVEFYPGGRFVYVYLLLSKVFKLKTVTVERGELLFWSQRNRYEKFMLKFIYNLTDLVWYREPYMLSILDQIKVKNKFFVHNCCDLPEKFPNLTEKDIDFLWVNRIIPERKVEWVFQFLSNHENFSTTIIGNLNDDNRVKEFFDTHPNSKIKIEKYIDPEPYYQRARFFLLPADVVFANNALLEAMSYGLIPLVSNVSGAEMIVNHLESGYIFDHTYDGFKKAVDWAMNISKKEYDHISASAKKKIQSVFSYQKYKQEYKKMIDSLY